MMAAPDEEAAPASSITVRNVTGEITVHDGVRPAETDVETFRAAVAAAREWLQLQPGRFRAKRPMKSSNRPLQMAAR